MDDSNQVMFDLTHTKKKRKPKIASLSLDDKIIKHEEISINYTYEQLLKRILI